MRRLLASLTRVLGTVLVSSLIVGMPVSVYGRDPVPGWLTTATVPRLELESGVDFCGAIVIRGAVLVSAQHCGRADTFVNYGSGYQRSRVDRVACSAYAEDFAVLRTVVPPGVASVEVWTGPLPNVGAMVWVAGYPGGRWTVRQLAVAAIWPNAVVRDTPRRVLPAVIAVRDVDLAQPGISGGAMFDAWGRLLAVMVVFNPVLGLAGGVPIQYGVERCPL